MNSIITDIFQGQTYNAVVCNNCKHKHISFDNFFSLSLSLPKSSIRMTHTCDLISCFNEFVKEEKMKSAEGFVCSNCKKTVDISKKIVIWRYPKVLVVHLKRFFCTTWRKEKLDTLIEVPSTLDLRSCSGESSIYIAIYLI